MHSKPALNATSVILADALPSSDLAFSTRTREIAWNCFSEPSHDYRDKHVSHCGKTAGPVLRRILGSALLCLHVELQADFRGCGIAGKQGSEGIRRRSKGNTLGARIVRNELQRQTGSI
jgi:hypothetical protein